MKNEFTLFNTYRPPLLTISNNLDIIYRKIFPLRIKKKYRYQEETNDKGGHQSNTQEGGKGRRTTEEKKIDSK